MRKFRCFIVLVIYIFCGSIFSHVQAMNIAAPNIQDPHAACGSLAAIQDETESTNFAYSCFEKCFGDYTHHLIKACDIEDILYLENTRQDIYTFFFQQENLLVSPDKGEPPPDVISYFLQSYISITKKTE